MENLLEETYDILDKYNLRLDKDVKWIGCKSFQISIEDFTVLANNGYDGGFGGQEVATDLVIVGKDWWLERHEYDGSEWWEFKQLPKYPDETKKIMRLVGGSWDNLEDLNKLKG